VRPLEEETKQLLQDPAEAESVLDDYDPYQELREATRRLTLEYVIDEEKTFSAILAFGSESAARRTLRQRWWNGQRGCDAA